MLGLKIHLVVPVSSQEKQAGRPTWMSRAASLYILSDFSFLQDVSVSFQLLVLDICSPLTDQYLMHPNRSLTYGTLLGVLW